MKRNYKRPFMQFVKKAHKPLKLAIEDAVDVVCATPDIGEMKTGDLSGIRVYKFRFNRQEYLVAYRMRTFMMPSSVTSSRGQTEEEYHDNADDSRRPLCRNGADAIK